jgi:hypothetical protein
MILLLTALVGGAIVGTLREAERNDYVTLEINTADKIEVKIQRGHYNPTILYTYGLRPQIIKAVNGVFDVTVTVRNISGNNHILVIVKDSDSKTLFTHIYLKPEFTINLKDII